MATSSPWVRLFVWLAALVAMALPLLGSGSGRNVEADRKAIQQLLGEQVDAWNRGDLDSFMDAYSRHEHLIFASDGKLTEGWDLAAARYAERYDSPEKMGELSFDILRVDLLGSRHAKVLGRWQLQRDADAPGGLFTLVLEHQAQGWRVIHDHTSSAD